MGVVRWFHGFQTYEGWGTRGGDMAEYAREDYRKLLEDVTSYAVTWLDSLHDRPVPARDGVEQLAKATGRSAAGGAHGCPRGHRPACRRCIKRPGGLGVPTVVAADEQGRVRGDALRTALDEVDGPTIVVLQAGNVHSGAFDPFTECVAAAEASGAWVHVDGAFGLWAAAAPARRRLTEGMAGADSWTTDAHKTLNVPYDSGLAIVADPGALRTAMGLHADYLLMDGEHLEPYEKVPEFSRRARAFTVWAALRSLGRRGVADLVEGLCLMATKLADGLRDIDGVEVLNDVDYTQVCLSFGDDARTEAVIQRLLEDGTTWMTGSRWRSRAVIRISVSNWSTDEEDVARSARRGAARSGRRIASCACRRAIRRAGRPTSCSPMGRPPMSDR
jgi:hypothetical protein